MAVTVDWAYLREGCVSCARARAALERSGAAIARETEARKERLDADAAWKLLGGAEEIVVGKGKKVLRLQPKAAGREAVLAEVMGRSGVLRAPTLRLGSRFLVGWNEALYAEHFPEAK